jgi:hypothetical protein
MEGCGCYRFAPEDCPVCGGEGLGWGCDGCGKDGGPCDRCHEQGEPGGCLSCARDSEPPCLGVEDQMIVEERRRSLPPLPPAPRSESASL